MQRERSWGIADAVRSPCTSRGSMSWPVLVGLSSPWCTFRRPVVVVQSLQSRAQSA